MRPTLLWGEQSWRQKPQSHGYSIILGAAGFAQSCAVHSPCSWPPAAAASPRRVLPGVFFTVMLKDAAQMKPE